MGLSIDIPYDDPFTDGGINMKPLFVPLKAEYFRAFERGEKTTEYRAYGPRWNEKTCIAGRDVLLSHGYSGKRIRAKIDHMTIIPASEIGSVIYSPDTRLAAIKLVEIGTN